MDESLQDLAAVRGDVLDVEHRLTPPGLLDDLLQGAVADVVHDDVAAGDLTGPVAARDEVADLDDARVADGDEVAAFDVGEPGAVVFVTVEQSLDGDDVTEMGVLGEVHPALAAVRDGPHDPVLVAQQPALGQLRLVRVARAAGGQNPSVGTCPSV